MPELRVPGGMLHNLSMEDPHTQTPNTMMYWRTDEPPRAKQAFNDYLGMGPGRSLELLYDSYLRAAEETETKPWAPLATLRKWATEYNWDQRLENKVSESASYDHELNRLDLMRLEHQSAVKRIEAWDEVQAEHRDRMVNMGNRLLERALEMLEQPIVKDEIDEDGVTVIRIPIKYTAGDIARYVEVADKVVRLAAEMDTSRDKTTVVSDERVEQMSRQFGLKKEDVLRKLDEIVAAGKK